MENPTNSSLDHFLDAVSSRTPTPGGGGVTAAAGALAAAMARMVAAYSLPKEPGETRTYVEGLADRFRTCDELLRALIREDESAYERMVGLRRAARQDASRQAEFEAAVLIAAAVPMQIAAVATTVLRLTGELQSVANEHLLSDLGVAAVLAEACVRAAGYTVRVNAKALSDETQRATVLRDIETTLAHAGEEKRRIEALLESNVEADRAG